MPISSPSLVDNMPGLLLEVYYGSLSGGSCNFSSTRPLNFKPSKFEQQPGLEEHFETMFRPAVSVRAHSEVLALIKNGGF